MSRAALTLSIIFALAVGAHAQDGGKIPWKGKGKDASDSPQSALAAAKSQGMATMMFFTSLG